MPPHPAHLMPVRNHVRAWLADLGVALDTARDIVVVTDEAMTNAVEHGSRPNTATAVVTLTLATQPGAIVLTVVDEGAWQVPTQGGDFGLPMSRVLADRADLRHEEGRTTLLARFRHAR
ncbi:ATP-binding protein [Actinokineospora sp. NBRC 105648]|uniref:ATP-binding protein n=1 Tax=Actinokineospora sp. NBRC 105648 TaxID=3032206 RepID=UPI002553D9C2|nr:ATP-binding protein [Actinokineospora sp. NBRC 105648]